jgi:short-subunit dehydrogenase involved in D-alanine esterification of teichoic acids
MRHIPKLQARGNTVIVGGRRAKLLGEIAAEHPGIDTVQIDKAESVVATNGLGPIRLMAAFIEHLRAQPDATIITVSSALAFVAAATIGQILARSGAGAPQRAAVRA